MRAEGKKVRHHDDALDAIADQSFEGLSDSRARQLHVCMSHGPIAAARCDRPCDGCQRVVGRFDSRAVIDQKYAERVLRGDGLSRGRTAQLSASRRERPW